MGNKYGTTVVHQGSSQRDESVVSWASRSSHGYNSPASDCSSEASLVFEQTYRDPAAEGNRKHTTERSSKKNGKVVVVNHRKSSKEPSGPSPSYSGGYSNNKYK